MKRSRYLLFMAILAGAMLVIAGHAGANPVVRIEASLTYHLSGNRVTGLSYRWRFDERFSLRNIATYNVNKNRRLDDDEVDQLRRDIFGPLAEHGFYIYLWHGEKPYADLGVSKFAATLDGNILVFDFHLPLQPAADPIAGPVSASLFDREYAIEFKFVKYNFLFVDGNMPLGCSFHLETGAGDRDGHQQIVTLKCGE